jgi:starch phosphorylase
MNNARQIAYFSMEIGLKNDIPTYSGGLGILAGDTIRAAADLKIPIVAVTLLFRKGYFFQRVDTDGWQREEPVNWVVEDLLKEHPERVEVKIETRPVHVRAWSYQVQGVTGYEIPVYFLDTDLPENSEWDRTLTDHLYGGDDRYRLCQELVLGIGGVRMLRALGYQEIRRFHMNEGHASLLTLELLNERTGETDGKPMGPEDVKAVHNMCVFTTHTPVPAGHDQFPMDLVRQVVANPLLSRMEEVFCPLGNLNMTYLALNLSRYVNGVAKKHGEVSRQMFAPYQVDSITNGVHVATWTSPPFKNLFDRYIAGWREDTFSLRYALSIPRAEIWEAHMQAKLELIRYVNGETNVGMDSNSLTVGFARRSTTYKRPALLFDDLDRLNGIASSLGSLQLVFAGKAHPQDVPGKELIKRLFGVKKALGDQVKFAFLEDYDMDLAKKLVAGVDLWLNTPEPPREASGTSGMKAAINGVPSLSVLDGWWLEGCIEGVTGWSIGERESSVPEPGSHQQDSRRDDMNSLYQKLEEVIVPIFYQRRDQFIEVMAHAIALNGSFFNTQRMLHQYLLKAYFG